jgi:hypothetical protein
MDPNGVCDVCCHNFLSDGVSFRKVINLCFTSIKVLLEELNKEKLQDEIRNEIIRKEL